MRSLVAQLPAQLPHPLLLERGGEGQVPGSLRSGSGSGSGSGSD